MFTRVDSSFVVIKYCASLGIKPVTGDSVKSFLSSCAVGRLLGQGAKCFIKVLANLKRIRHPYAA